MRAARLTAALCAAAGLLAPGAPASAQGDPFQSNPAPKVAPAPRPVRPEAEPPASPAPAVAAPPAAPSRAGAEGVYRGRLRCAAIPSLTLGPVEVDFTMTVRGAGATYQRPVLSFDGKQTVGQETGTGTVGADGAVVLQGGITGSLGAFTARYTGRLAGTHLDLSGTANFTAPRQYERTCSVSLDRG